MCKTVKSLENQRRIAVEQGVEIIHKVHGKLEDYPQRLENHSQVSREY